MENNNDFNQEKKENITISKKSLYIAGGVALALVLLIGGYFAFSNKNEAKDTVVKNDSLAVKKDSATINADSLKNSEGYDEESPYQSYSLIANAVSLPNGQKLKFGDRVFIHYENEGQEFKTAYLNDPTQYPSAKNNPISLNENMIIPTYSFEDFKNIISEQRMNRYLLSVNRDTRKAQTLYRKNLKLSQEIFTIISCFEVALRNRIDVHYTFIWKRMVV